MLPHCVEYLTFLQVSQQTNQHFILLFNLLKVSWRMSQHTVLYCAVGSVYNCSGIVIDWRMGQNTVQPESGNSSDKNE